MTFEDQIASLFARANPVPSLDLLDPIEVVDMDHLTAESERSSSMSEIHTLEPKVVPERRRPFAVLVAAAALVVVAIGVVITLANRQPDDAVTPAETIAMTYMEAMSAKDLATLTEVVAPELGIDFDELPRRWEYERATGWVFPPLGCEEQSTSLDGTLVSCLYSNDGSWMEALGLEPDVGRDVLLIRDGQVHEVTGDSSYSQPGVGQAWFAFREWVEQNHWRDLATIYDTGNPRYTPEAVALWEQFTEEFVAEMEASG